MMKILKWLVVFLLAFILAWILIFTFTQEQFRAVASARILTYRTPAIPIYLYVAAAFGTGLLLGLFTAFYYYIVLRSRIHNTTKELRQLEQQLAEAKNALEQCRQTPQTYDASSSFPEQPTPGSVETAGYDESHGDKVSEEME